MKKTIFSSVLLGVMFMVGCSKQPSLENAQELNQTTTQPQEIVQADTRVVGGEESVNTANAKVEEQTISSSTNNTSTQSFAKKLANIVIYFDFDKYNIKKSEWPKVEKLANFIKSYPGDYVIRIEGNCDEWGTEEYNYALGLKRANSVKNALIKLGVDPKKLTVISYGELNPVCKAHAKWCWKLNRRDNFTYLP